MPPTSPAHPAPAPAETAAASPAAAAATGTPEGAGPAASGPPRLARDAHGVHLVNFPFACSVCVLGIAGLVLSGCGLMGIHVGLTVFGSLLTFAAGVLYAGSLTEV